MAKKAGGAAKKAGKPVDEEVEEDGVEEPKNASSKAVESGKLNEQVVGALLEGLTCDGHRIKVTKLAGSTSGADVEFTVKNIPPPIIDIKPINAHPSINSKSDTKADTKAETKPQPNVAAQAAGGLYKNKKNKTFKIKERISHLLR